MATADLRAIINGSGSEDHSTGNLELVAMTFDVLAELNHTVSVEVCSRWISKVSKTLL